MIYNLLLFIGSLFYLPKFLWKWFFCKKQRPLLLQRIGWHIPSPTLKKPVIWVHAISLGETKSCRQLLCKIRESHPDSYIILSSVTETGFEEAKTFSFIDDHFLIPLDFSWNMKRLMNHIKPTVLVLIETDFWLNMLFYAKRKNTKIILVSGKISKKSTKCFLKTKKFARKLFSYIDVFCVQNMTYKTRFQNIGVPNKKIKITGNLKYDQETPYLNDKDLIKWKNQLGLFDEDRVITIASTHAPEEKLLITELKKVWDIEGNLKIFLAPRHPDRFINVANILQSENIPFIPLSKIEKKTNTEKVILIDTMGFLPVCYQLSELAIIGGSFREKIGGHNILEPNFYSLPVFFGPYMRAQIDLKNMITKAASGSQIQIHELSNFLLDFLKNQEDQKLLRRNASTLIASLKGRVNETYHVILPFLQTPS